MHPRRCCTPQVVILLAGLLPNASVALSTMGICLNINAWMYMLPLGLGQAVNTSISNALGAGEAIAGAGAAAGVAQGVPNACIHHAWRHCSTPRGFTPCPAVTVSPVGPTLSLSMTSQLFSALVHAC